VRLNREVYFMAMANLVSERSTCRVRVGAVAIKDNRVIMTGYNGSPSGQPHCTDVGCYMVNGHCIRTIHAETNIITQCAKNGVSLSDSTIYCTHKPCVNCIRLLESAGVSKVIFGKDYKRDHEELVTDLNIIELQYGEKDGK
jgi:dCMP deaminase